MNFWDQVLALIETKVNRHSFYTWFRPTTFVSDERTSITVRVPNVLFKDWLTKHYAGVISEATAELRRPNLIIHFVSDTVTDGVVIPLSAEEAAVIESGPLPTTQAGLTA
jgi:chromosomal replication initiator protein